VTVGRSIFVTTSGGGKFTGWSALESRFLEPANFAVLRFHGQAFSVAEAAAETDKSGAIYRRALEADIRAAVESGAQVVTTLRRAARDSRFATRAKGVLGKWDAIRATAEQGTSAPLPTIRTALSKLHDLVSDSEKIAYSYLIEELLAK